MTKQGKGAQPDPANGKPITFHTRHHWILTWLLEQPGRSLADRVWHVIDRAYRADYAERGRRALCRYWSVLDPHDLRPAIDALTEACDAFSRAGMPDRYQMAHEMLVTAAAAHARRQQPGAALVEVLLEAGQEAPHVPAVV